ncbi:MAG: PQQ-binding-like beta-propeller repeat protein [Gemmataceae bacterium]|nr:PQQ-binding-like beta-propeller repeat protein [Gemmataceae bacterium]
MGGFGDGCGPCPAVVPVLVGPLQVLLTILPGLIVALAGGLLAVFTPSGFKNAVKLLWRQKIAVATIAALGIGVYVTAQRWWPRGVAGIVTTAQAGSDWTTARGGLTRCGAVLDRPSPARRELIWSYRDGAEGFLASPAVVGNRVYIASATLGISRRGAILCLDADAGGLVWKNAPANYRPTFSSPVIAGDYLVCGEGLHDTRDARIVCLDVKNKGNVVWTFRTKNHVECTPVIANGRVYVGAGDDGYYCLDLKPGPDGKAIVRWRLPADKYPDAETSLAVHDGKVYAGLGNNGAALVVLDAETGKELHRVKMPYPVFSPASSADGKLYVGMGNGTYVEAGQGGAVHCLDLKTLKTDWTLPLAQTVLGAVAIKDDKLYVGSSDGQLYCLSRAGKLIKTFDTGACIKTSPAVTDEHVLIVNDTGILFALDRHTLAPVWDFRLGTEGMFYSSPVVARGHVYVGTENDGLLCVGKPASSKRVVRWATPLGGPGVAGNSDSSPIPLSGAIQWTYPEKAGSANEVGAPVAVWDEHVYVARAGGAERGLECLALERDEQKPPRRIWNFHTARRVETSPVVLGKSVACLDGARGSADREFYVLDGRTGEKLAQHRGMAGQGPSPAPGTVTATRHQYLVQTDHETLTSFDEDGSKQWSAIVGPIHHAPASTDAMILVVAEAPARALALDRASGAELWQIELPHGATATPLLEKNKFILPTRDGMEARSLIDGQLLTSWRHEFGSPSGELAVKDSLLVFVNQQGVLVAYDRIADKAAARVPGALPGQTPLVSRDKVIYAAAGRLMMLTLGADNPPELWLDLSMTAPQEGLPCGPLVLTDSRLLTVLPGRGLACLGALP